MILTISYILVTLFIWYFTYCTITNYSNKEYTFVQTDWFVRFNIAGLIWFLLVLSITESLVTPLSIKYFLYITSFIIMAVPLVVYRKHYTLKWTKLIPIEDKVKSWKDELRNTYG
jgi:uncharacterized membrane protein